MADLRVLVVAGDAGGAAALAPVCRALAARGTELAAWGYAQAPAVWERLSVSCRSLEPGFGEADARRRVAETAPDALLLGTSVNGRDHEREFVRAGRERRIPSLAVLDFWSRYRERFEDAGGALEDLPDRVAVMDERAREEMLAAGFPAGVLEITGSPALEDLGPEWAARVDRGRVRRSLGVGPEELLVVYASQPLRLVGPEPECEVLAEVVGALPGRDPTGGREVVLLVRPHPREDPARLVEATRRARARVVVSGAGDPREVVASADLVLGRSSVLLLEAGLLGRPVLSLQPGAEGDDPLPSNRWGLTRPVYRVSGIAPAIREALEGGGRGPGPPRACPIERDSTRRILRLLDRMVESVRGTRGEGKRTT